jgi:hypothetical protein
MRLRTVPLPSVVLASVLALGLLAGCGSEPPQIDPTGIDELVVPTPDPDPADFVDGVDHPLLALAPGTVATFRDPGDPRTTLRAEVLTATEEVAGVTATVVRTTEERRGRVRSELVERVAEDAEGNVWLLAARRTTRPGTASSDTVEWETGVDGAEAGLVLPAEPRLGDGWARTAAPGVAEDYVEVREVGGTVTVGSTTREGAVVLEETSGLDPEVSALATYVPGAGLVRREVLSGPDVGTFELVDLAEGP